MSENEYIPRLMDDILRKKLDFYGAVSLEGCKWCGKSTTAKRIAKSVLEIQDPTTAENNKTLALNDPMILLSGEKPRLIDEWQDTPTLWDAIRYDVDKSGLSGQYILTGSVTPKKRKPNHSGAGRILRLTMRPMTMFESGDSTGQVSLSELFYGSKDVSGTSALGPREIAHICVRGGWPASVKREGSDVRNVATEYLEAILSNETSRDSDNDIMFSPTKMRIVIRSLARNIASPVTLTTIMKDAELAGEPITDKTLALYLDVLTRIHVLDDVEPWSTQLRSKTTIRAGAKRCFSDPSLVTAALLASEEDLRMDSRAFGAVFESLAIRDLRVYAESLGGHLYYYRDKAGRESDGVIHLSDGKWCAIEVKLGSSEEAIEEGAESLKKFLSNVDTGVMREPSFMMVLTATTNYAYRREDGIYVVPIGCLKP